MSDTLDDWVADCKAAMLKDAKDRTRRAAEAVVLNTPVGHKHPSGRHRNSWRAAIGEAPTDTDPGPELHDPSGQTALMQIEDVIDNLQLGQTLYVATDMAGMTELEEGTRKRAPSRMLAAGVNGWSD